MWGLSLRLLQNLRGTFPPACPCSPSFVGSPEVSPPSRREGGQTGLEVLCLLPSEVGTHLRKHQGSGGLTVVVKYNLGTVGLINT